MSTTRRVSILLLTALLAGLNLRAQKPIETYQGKAVIAQQVLVRFRNPTPSIVQATQQLLGADGVRQVGGVAGPYVFHSVSQNVSVLLTLLSGHNELFYAEPDFLVHSNAVPNDPSFPQLWGLQNTAGTGADIRAVPAWDISTGSTANVAGVVDTGIDYTHPDLAANVWSAPTSFTVTVGTRLVTCPAGSHGYNAILGACDPKDDHGHGTHVSGTIGAVGNNGTGVTGVNWRTQILGLKFLDSQGNGALSDAIDAIEFAIQAKLFFAATATPLNVRVLSASWGGDGFSQSLLDEINKAGTNNILFVAAAGNSASNDDTQTFYPASYNAANQITVAATDGSDVLASFSNYGKNTVHLGAPGVSILSTLPNNSYGYLSGTSMATPHVSGAAMLVLSACTLTTAALKTTLLSNVDAVASLASVTVSGGRLNVNKAIRSCAQSSGGASSIWGPGATPGTSFLGDFNPVTLGMKFRSDSSGSITGIRFYKGAGNNGTHTGLLYSSSGTLLAQATFSGETASGWQQVAFSPAVSISANTTYIAAYFTTSGYAVDRPFFTSAGVDNAPLHALRSGVDGPNGLYIYAGAPQFPFQSYADSNYWVDVVFSSGSPNQVAVPNVVGLTQAAATTSITGAGLVVGTVTQASSSTVPAGNVIGENPAAGTLLNAGSAVSLVVSSGPGQVAVPNVVGLTQAAATTSITGAGLAVGTVTQASSSTVPAGNVIGENPAAGTLLNAGSAVSLVISTGPASSSTSVWSSAAVPGTPFLGDFTPVTLGMKFRSDTSGSITGIRFYKGAGNNGTHTGLLYSSSGTLLAQATFSGETASGWQQVAFSSAVNISANTTYIAAYFTTSGYADDRQFFTSAVVDNAPLHALRSGVDGPNGVYIYAGAPQFPSQSYADSNYWVDVVFSSGSPNQVAVPNVVGQTQAAATTSITGAGLAVGTVTQASSSTVPAGNVIGENPAAGTLLNAGSAVSLVISTGPASSSTSVWSSAAVPGTPFLGDFTPATLGMKFRSDTSGSITGIRFYKGAGNNSTHTGLLYSNSGALLAQATFSGETASGWQQVTFSPAVSISANTTYIAAYFTTSGYADDRQFFTSAGVDHAPLHALRSGVDGPNGVYIYAGAPQFPSQSYADSNYWVDVIFQ